MTVQWLTLMTCTHCSLMPMAAIGGVVMDSAFVRADYDFITKSGLEGWFDLVENIALQNQQATSA